MSVLVDRAIANAKLADVVEARRSGVLNENHVARLRAADLLVLGAIANRTRAAEVGDGVAIYTDGSPRQADAGVIILPAGPELAGLALLREIAMARVTGPRGVRVRVDWTRCGLELAQIALGFGANELAGRIVSKRGLPLAEGEKLGVGKKSRLESAEIVKRRELEGFVRRAGRTPSFVQEVADA